MTRPHEHEIRALGALKQAVSEVLERKRRLGQYAVIWRDGRPVCIGPDAPVEHYRYDSEASGVPGGVAEPGNDDCDNHQS